MDYIQAFAVMVVLYVLPVAIVFALVGRPVTARRSRSSSTTLSEEPPAGRPRAEI